jgi:hypothetical protein
MTEYTPKAIWHMCYAAVLSEALRASLDRAQKPEMIAKVSRDIADAATREALDRWPPERPWDQNLGPR